MARAMTDEMGCVRVNQGPDESSDLKIAGHQVFFDEQVQVPR